MGDVCNPHLRQHLLMSCCDDNDNSGHEQPALSECTIIFYGVGGRNLDADIYENLRQLYRGLRDNSNMEAVVFFKNSFNPNPDMMEKLNEQGFDFHKATAYKLCCSCASGTPLRSGHV